MQSQLFRVIFYIGILTREARDRAGKWKEISQPWALHCTPTDLKSPGLIISWFHRGAVMRSSSLVIWCRGTSVGRGLNVKPVEARDELSLIKVITKLTPNLTSVEIKYIITMAV